MKIAILALLTVGTAFTEPRFEPYQNGARRPGADKQHNIGSTVTNPPFTNQTTSQKPPAQEELDKIEGDDPEAETEETRTPRTQRESGIPTIEAELPEEQPSPVPDMGGNIRQSR